MSNLFLKNLQLFGEGGDGGASAAPAGAPGAGSAGTGVTAPAAGVQEQQAQPTKTPEEEFEELIAGEKYKSIFQKRVSGIVGERIKGKTKALDDANAKLERANGLLRTVGTRAYGMDFGADGAVDYDAFQTHVDADREMISKAAANAGLSEEAYLERERYKKENAALKAERDAAFNRSFYDRVWQQAEVAKADYPDLDIQKEMENPAFATLIRGGFNVKNAYESVHHAEIVERESQKAARSAELRLSNTIQAQGARPVENGVQPHAASKGSVDPHPRNWSKEYREQIKRDTRRGHPPTF